MTFDWNEFQGQAEGLAKAPDEGSYRSAISRAYYAAYNLTLSELQRQGFVLPDKDPHWAVWNHAKSLPDRRWQDIGFKGGTLRLKRTDADYRDHLLIGQRDAALAVGLSRALIAVLASVSI